MKTLITIMILLITNFANAGMLTHGDWSSDGSIISYNGENETLASIEWLSWAETDGMSIFEVERSSLTSDHGWSVATSDILSLVFNDFFDTSAFDSEEGKAKRAVVSDNTTISFASIFGTTFYSDVFVNDLTMSSAWSYDVTGEDLYAASVSSEYQVFDNTLFNDPNVYVRDYSRRFDGLSSFSHQMGVALIRGATVDLPGEPTLPGDPVVQVSEPQSLGMFAMLCFGLFMSRTKRA